MKIYQRNWQTFLDFCYTTLKLSSPLPAEPAHVCLFLTQLTQKGLAYRTITTYTSAISFVHKMGQHRDPTSTFVVHKTLQGIQNQASRTTGRQLSPITRDILNKLVSALPAAQNSPYDQRLWTAVFTLTYHACLRAGEVVCSNTTEHTLSLDQVRLTTDSIHIKFQSYKHTRTPTPTMVLPQDYDSICCPVQALRQYLQLRGISPGPLFIDENRIPIDRQRLSATLKSSIQLIGLNPANYNTHSFRIGRATQLAQDNHTHSTIQATGRWHSSAYLRYIRPQTITLPN